jgi:hypothetical protein
MPIAEKFTADELDEFVTANPDMKEVINGSKVAKEKYKSIYDGLDTDLNTASGLQKAGDEKTYAFAKRVVGHYKTAAEQAATQLTERQQTIADLQQKIANGSGDATLKARLEALEAKEQEYQTKLTAAETKLFQQGVEHGLDRGLLGLKFDPTVKESVRKVLINNAKAQIVAMAKVQENADKSTQIVYVKDGKTILGADGKTPADAAYIVADMLKDVLDAGHKGAGGGADEKPPVDDKGNVKVPEQRPADVKTKDAVNTWLLGLGVKKGTKEFDDAYRTHAQGLPLR